jgi:hypothetical protein
MTPTTPYVFPGLTTAQETLIIRGHKVMQGLQADSYWANSSNCFNRITNLTYKVIPAYQHNVTDVLDQGQAATANQSVEASSYYSSSVYSTRLIQILANDAWICNSMVTNMVLWVNYKYSLFPDFVSFATGFFQNLLAKVVSINNIYNSILAKQANGDMDGIYYDLARLMRILMDF